VLLGILCALVPLLMLLTVPTLIIYFIFIKHSATRHMAFMAVMMAVNDLVHAQLAVILSMVINFSTMYRLALLTYALYIQSVNP